MKQLFFFFILFFHSFGLSAQRKNADYQRYVEQYADLAIEICLSPKSNSGIMAIYKGLDDIQNGKIFPIPNHIKDNNYKSSTKLGHKGYKYPHDYGGYVKQQYLPDELKNTKYYSSLSNGIEEKLNALIKSFSNQLIIV